MRSSLILLLSLASSSAWAAAADTRPVCDGDLCATPMRAGEAAPYAGQLLTTALAVQLGQKADAAVERVRVEVELAHKLAAVDLELERRLRKLDADAAGQRESALERALANARPPWWERPAVVASVSVALSVAVMLASAELASRSR